MPWRKQKPIHLSLGNVPWHRAWTQTDKRPRWGKAEPVTWPLRWVARRHVTKGDLTEGEAIMRAIPPFPLVAELAVVWPLLVSDRRWATKVEPSVRDASQEAWRHMTRSCSEVCLSPCPAFGFIHSEKQRVCPSLYGVSSLLNKWRPPHKHGDVKSMIRYLHRGLGNGNYDNWKLPIRIRAVWIKGVF